MGLTTREGITQMAPCPVGCSIAKGGRKIHDGLMTGQEGARSSCVPRAYHLFGASGKPCAGGYWRRSTNLTRDEGLPADARCLHGPSTGAIALHCLKGAGRKRGIDSATTFGLMGGPSKGGSQPRKGGVAASRAWVNDVMVDIASIAGFLFCAT